MAENIDEAKLHSKGKETPETAKYLANGLFLTHRG